MLATGYELKQSNLMKTSEDHHSLRVTAFTGNEQERVKIGSEEESLQGKHFNNKIDW
jgi:hypothetical protein